VQDVLLRWGGGGGGEPGLYPQVDLEPVVVL
jgi:hypothetical protein